MPEDDDARRPSRLRVSREFRAESREQEEAISISASVMRIRRRCVLLGRGMVGGAYPGAAIVDSWNSSQLAPGYGM